MQRDPRIDVAKGALISLVVLGHYLDASGRGSGPTLTGWMVDPQAQLLFGIYLFHMPAFVFLAGLTASPRGVGRRMVQIATILLFFQVLYVGGGRMAGVDLSWTQPFYGLWFLAALLLWLPTVPLVVRFPRAAVAASILVALAAGFLPDGASATITRVAWLLPFFVIGHLTGKALLRRIGERPSLMRRAVAPLVLGGLVVYVASQACPLWIRGNIAFAGLGADAPAGLLGRGVTLALAAVATVALLVALPSVNRMLEVLGRRSLAIYTLHLGGTVVLEQFYERFGPEMSNGTAIAFALLATLAALTVFGGPGFFDRAIRWLGSAPLRLRPARERAII
jgi:fucose 4-O-acetylase-like acetyltransferase